MFLYDIIKVLYSPLKAFQEILANPKIIGSIIIVIISLFLTVSSRYMSASKHYIETITPATRVAWTNMTNPTSTWTSNAPLENITATLVSNEMLVGNSVNAFISDNDTIWLKTINIETINCSENSEFRTFYYKLMYNNSKFQNASTANLKLYSLKNESRYFEFDLLSNDRYLGPNAVWVDANISLSDSGWVPINSPDWSSITGIEFRLGFSNATELTLRLNDLHFGGKYESYVSIIGSTALLTGETIDLTVDTLLYWTIFAAMVWLTLKVFKAESSLKTLMIFIGYVFVVAFVREPLNMLLISQLPLVYFPFSATVFLNPQLLSTKEIETAPDLIASIYNKNWLPTAVYPILNIIIPVLFAAWTIALVVIVVKTLHGFSWGKAALIAIIAYSMTFFLHAMMRAFMLLA
ncbi:MAG: YIP1 family protein [Candidatus Bathyarchaeales archaeon]